MSKFKAGDIVECVDNKGVTGLLTKGRRYQVEHVHINGDLKVSNDKGVLSLHPYFRFTKATLNESQDDEPTEALTEPMQDNGGAWRDNIKDCKPPMRYVNPNLVEGMAFGMLAGELKYESFNFLKGFKYSVILESLERHLNAIKKGEEFDEQTTKILKEGYTCPRTGVFKSGFGDKAPKIRHEWLIACNLNMIQWCREQETLIEDRVSVKE